MYYIRKCSIFFFLLTVMIVIAPGSARAVVTTSWISDGDNYWIAPNCWENLGTGYPHNTSDYKYDCTIDRGVTVTIDRGTAITIDALSLGVSDNVQLGPDGTGYLTISGGPVTNNGTIFLASTHWDTRFTIDGDVTFDGAGELVINSNEHNSVRAVTNGDRLTNGSNHTIRGAYYLGLYTLPLFTNHGTLDGDSSGYTLTVSSYDTGTNYNDGIIQSSNGGTLRLSGGTWDNTDGVIQALNESVTEFYEVSVSNGTLTTSGTGIVDLTGGSKAENLTNSGILRVPNSAYYAAANLAYLKGTITNTGTIALAGSHFSQTLYIDGDVTLDGSGELDGVAVSLDKIQGVSENDRLTHSSDHTIRGSVNLGNDQMALTNHGTISADDSGQTLKIDSTDSATNYNDGTMGASDGGTLQLYTSTWDNTGGVIQALDESTTQIYYATVSGGALSSSGTGVIELGYDSRIADLTNNAYVWIRLNSHTAYFQGEITNNDTIETGTWATLAIDSDVTVSGSGIILIREIEGTGYTLTNGSNHTLQSTGVNEIDPLVVNEGTLYVPSETSLSLNATYDPSSRSITRVDGTLMATGTTALEGKLSGSGTFIGSLDVGSTGTIAPGNSAGTLKMTGDCTMSNTSVLQIELSGITSGSEYDVLSVTGAVELDGELNVKAIDSYMPEVGQQFVILTASSISGAFNEVTGRGEYSVTYNDNNVTITVVKSPPKTIVTPVLLLLLGD